MISRFTRALTVLVKRAAHDWLMLSAAVVTVLMATTLLAAGPIYADAVSVGSLQRALDQADPREANVAVSIRRPVTEFDTLAEVAAKELGKTVDSVGGSVVTVVEGDPQEIVPSRGDLVDLAVFRSMEGIEGQATLSAGRWPADGTEIEAAIPSNAAELLGVGVGDDLTMTSRRDQSAERIVEITGVYVVDDVQGDYWMSEELIVAGTTESSTFRSLGPFIATEQTIVTRLVERQARYEWRLFPDRESMTPASISELSRDVLTLQDRLDGGLEDREDFISAEAAIFSIDTNLPVILSDATRSLTVTRTGVLMLSAQLAILAAYALVLTAGLMVETRRTETNLLRSRGAGRRQLMGLAVAEGLLITIPAALAAPWLAALALNVLNKYGPLAAANLELRPNVTTASYVVALIAAVGCTLALAIPSYRAARSFGDPANAHEREETRRGAQRLGVDVALLLLAAFAFWQLNTFGATISSRFEGLGVDPLLIAAPALGLLAGGTLALRTVPLLSKLAERAAARGRATVVALSSWQVARRPRRYARSALLLVMAIAIGLFTASYTTTWSQSQADRADFQTGADVRVSPDRRVGASISDLQLSVAHEQIPEINESMPVFRRTAQISTTDDTLGRYVMLDASRAGEMTVIREDLITTDFNQLMGLLADERPAIGAIPLPRTPQRLSLIVDASVEDLPEEFPEELINRNGFRPTMRVVLQDGDGLLHRIAVGEIPLGQGATRLVADLTHTEPGGLTFSPVYPVSLVDIEIINLTPLDIPRIATVALRDISVSAEAGGPDWETVDVTLDGSAWEMSRFANGRVRQAPSIVVTNLIESTGALQLTIDSGDSATPSPIPVHFSIRPRGTDLPESFPIVVTEGFLEATAASVGDSLDLGIAGSEQSSATIVGTVVEFPTVEPDQGEAVLIDLATFQMMNYRVGLPIARPNEYWVGLNEPGAPVADQLLAAPYSSPQVTSRVTRAEVLRTDPIALGTVASLSLGFVAATVFAAVGFAVSATVSARERLTEFALLRALGLSNKQLSVWLVIEQSALVVASLVLGTVVGAVLAALILPLISITQGGAAAVPAPEVIIPIGTIAGLEMAVVAALLVIVGGLALTLRRIGLGSVLRIGED